MELDSNWRGRNGLADTHTHRAHRRVHEAWNSIRTGAGETVRRPERRKTKRELSEDGDRGPHPQEMLPLYERPPRRLGLDGPHKNASAFGRCVVPVLGGGVGLGGNKIRPDVNNIVHSQSRSVASVSNSGGGNREI